MKQSLQLSVAFHRIYTTDENGSQEQGHWIRFLDFAGGWERYFQQVIVDDYLNYIDRLFQII